MADSRPINDNLNECEQAIRRIIRLSSIRCVDAVANGDHGHAAHAQEIKALGELALRKLLAE